MDMPVLCYCRSCAATPNSNRHLVLPYHLLVSGLASITSYQRYLQLCSAFVAADSAAGTREQHVASAVSNLVGNLHTGLQLWAHCSHWPDCCLLLLLQVLPTCLGHCCHCLCRQCCCGTCCSQTWSLAPGMQMLSSWAYILFSSI